MIFINPTIHRGMSQADYFAIEALSRSDLVAINESPARWKHGAGIQASKAMDFGTLVHAIALEGSDMGLVVEIDAADWRSKAAKDARDEARAEGKIPILSNPKSDKEISMDRARECAYRVGKRWPFIDGTDCELVIVATHEDTGLLVKCRLDGILFDLKTTGDASHEGFRKSVSHFDYATQAAIYGDMAVSAELVQTAEGFAFYAVESKPPYLTGEYTLDPEWIEAGRARYEDALLAASLFNETVWPSDYGTHVLYPRSWDL